MSREPRFYLGLTAPFYFIHLRGAMSRADMLACPFGECRDIEAGRVPPRWFSLVQAL